MSEPQFESLQLVGSHEPDFSVETDPATGHKFQVELPGFFRFGVKFGDKFVELYRVKAGDILEAKKAQEQPASEAPPSV